MKRLGRWLKNAPRNTWELGDTIPKIAGWLKEYKRTGSADTATKLVRNRYPDYPRAWVGLITSSRSRGARALKATVMPRFVNFLSEAVRIGADTAHKKPVSLMTGLFVLGALGKMSQRAAGITDEEAEKLKKAAPAWMRATGLATPVWFQRDEHGNPQILDLTYILPLGQQAGDVFGEEDDDAKRGRLSLLNNPMTGLLEDLLRNKDRFYGDDIAKEGGSEYAAWVQRLRYSFDELAPSLATKLTGLGRRPGSTYRALTGQEDRFGNVPDLRRALLSDIGGVTLRPIDIEKETEKKLLDFKYRRVDHVKAQNAAAKRGDDAEVKRIQTLIDALDAKVADLSKGRPMPRVEPMPKMK